MRPFLILFLAFLLSYPVQAQEWKWVVKKPEGYVSLISDKEGNIYDYANNSWIFWWTSTDFRKDTSGTHIRKFDENGNLLKVIRFPQPFYIRSLIYDNNGGLYFTGAYGGDQSVSGIPLKEMGWADAMVGKMDTTGNVLWVKSFGGSDFDLGNDICFSHDSSEIFITGFLSDDFNFDGQLIDPGTNRLFFARLSLSGDLIRYNLTDYREDRNYDSNWGMEVASDKHGNYFLLGRREGQWWMDDTIPDSPEGVYVFKISQELDVLWSTYIIGPSCYYGYKVGNLTIGADGDPYVTRFCSSKYGGVGEVVRLEGVKGNITWEYGNDSDLGYSALAADPDNGDIYVVGNEEADLYPGPGSHPGHHVIKRFNTDNQLIWGEKLLVWLGAAALTADKDLITAGHFRYKTATFGDIQVDADSSEICPGCSWSHFATVLASMSTGQQRRCEKVDSLDNVRLEVHVSPNPTSGVAGILVKSEDYEPVVIRVTNSLGQEIYYERILNPVEDILRIVDLSGRNEGVYFVEVRKRDKRTSRILLVTRN